MIRIQPLAKPAKPAPPPLVLKRATGRTPMSRWLRTAANPQQRSST